MNSNWKNILFATLAIAGLSFNQLNAANVLLIGGQPDAAQGDDSFVLEHLEDVLNHTVTYIAANESFTDDVDGQDLLILSSTFGSGDARGKFQDSEIPIMQWEEALVRWDHGDPDGNFRMTEFSRNGQTRETTVIKIVDSAVGHPLAAGLAAGDHEIFDDISRTPQQFGTHAPGLIRIAELDEEWAEDDVSIWFDENENEITGPEFVLTAIDKGGELGPADEGFFAPEKRVNFPLEDTGFSLLNDTGLSLFNASVDWLLGGGGGEVTPGDYNDDGNLDVLDLNLQADAIASGDLAFDENGDGAVDSADRVFWAKELKKTWVGDANLDGEFNSGDLVGVFEAGKFEQDVDATWGEGDWDGDKRFGSGDFVAAFQDGGFELGPIGAEVSSVPEPNSLCLLVLGMLGMLRFRRK